MNKKAVGAKERKAIERARDFDEVVSPYTEGMALEEASRCLQCKDPICITGCPVGIDIKKFIHQITGKNYRSAYLTIREKNNFPSICGRVCPAEYQCRKACVLTKRDSPFSSPDAINIHFLERFAGDYGIKHNIGPSGGKNRKLSGFKIAVVGSGPAGIACAGELAREGVRVTVFEAFYKQAYDQSRLKAVDPSIPLPGNSFQSLDKTKDIFLSQFNLNLFSCLSQTEIDNLYLLFNKRHILTHNLGIIDQKFLRNTGLQKDILNYKVEISKTEVLSALESLEKIVKYIKGNLF